MLSDEDEDQLPVASEEDAVGSEYEEERSITPDEKKRKRKVRVSSSLCSPFLTRSFF